MVFVLLTEGKIKGTVSLLDCYDIHLITIDKYLLNTPVIRELGGLVLTRGPKLCNFVEWREFKVVYKRYARLYFCMCIDQDDNELEVLEIIHHFVENLDRYFGSVCELDLIFNFHKVKYTGQYFIRG